MIVDSSLTVKVSVILEDNFHIYEKLQLEKDAHLKKDVFVGNEIKVDGNAHMIGNAYFYNNVNLLNLQTLDPSFFSSFDYSNPINTLPELLYVDENGMMLKSGSNSIVDIIYKSPCKTDLNGDVPNPTWQNGLNKIYSQCARVGIHNSNPRVSLDVSGKAYVSHLAIGGADPSQQTARFHLKESNLSSTSNSNIFIIENNQRELVQINNQGLLTAERILIKNPTFDSDVTDYVLQIENSTQKLLQLQSNGLMRARKIRVDSDSWADFVFDENYQLMSTTDLRKFIAENHHLPNVPEAKVVVEEGIDLAEMNKVLLQKVEELTLYMLQQQKEIEILKHDFVQIVKTR